MVTKLYANTTSNTDEKQLIDSNKLANCRLCPRPEDVDFVKVDELDKLKIADSQIKAFKKACEEYAKRYDTVLKFSINGEVKGSVSFVGYQRYWEIVLDFV